MRAVVTGAAGFIGSTLSRRLLSDGWEVVGVDNLSDYYDPELKRGNLARLDDVGFTHVNQDLADDDLDRLLDGANVVFHLAAQPGVSGSWGGAFGTYVRNNILATQRLLDACLKNGVPRVVYASSSSVYGNAELYPVTEDTLVRPYSPYGVTKLSAEHLCRVYSENFGLSTVSLRLFTVYGPGQRPDMAFSRFISAALEGRNLTINGDGLQLRDFTFVDDVVEAFLLASGAEVEPGFVANVAGGSSATVRDVVTTLAGVCGPLNVTAGPAQPGDVRRTEGSSERARSHLGWRPTVPLREGLARQVQWARAGGS